MDIHRDRIVKGSNADIFPCIFGDATVLRSFLVLPTNRETFPSRYYYYYSHDNCNSNNTKNKHKNKNKNKNRIKNREQDQDQCQCGTEPLVRFESYQLVSSINSFDGDTVRSTARGLRTL